MFVKNKYYKWYYTLIEENRHLTTPTGYVEVHHILPRALGGTDDATNLISLSARKHFICHLLLALMTEGEAKRKMVHAINLMKRLKKRYRITSRTYEMIKHWASNARRGVPRSQETKDKIRAKLKGRKLSEEHSQNIRAAQIGTKRSLETRLKFSKMQKSKWESKDLRERHSKLLKGKKKSEEYRERMRGKILSEETKLKISLAKQGKSLSAEHKAKIALAGIGRVVSVETGSRISLAKKGKKLSEAHKAALRKPKRSRCKSPDHLGEALDPAVLHPR